MAAMIENHSANVAALYSHRTNRAGPPLQAGGNFALIRDST